LLGISASMGLAGVVIACIGGYVVVAVRQDRRTRRNRVAEILGYLLVFGGLVFFIVGIISNG
jgi:hypothetical protein